ncbi:hypothetical protein [Arthrobacter celericrescens]|uniref:hypothetical protein n=1 Tax=Arthrobacter celericrescens TaxID=2320851 RepID=UPI000EA2FFC0|nr:hypothetical protein [Arthrobacter celericrescens]
MGAADAVDAVAGRLGGWTGRVSAVLGSVQGSYTLLGTSDVDEQRQAWQGLGALGFAGVRTSLAVQRGLRNVSVDDLSAIMTVAEAGKSALRIGKWENDFAFSAGSVGFDVGSLLVGGGAVVKGGSLGAKAGALADDAASASSGLVKSLDDVASLRGATAGEIRDLIPEGWVERALKKGDGVRFLNPKRPGESIAIENGWPGQLTRCILVRISRSAEMAPLSVSPCGEIPS